MIITYKNTVAPKVGEKIYHDGRLYPVKSVISVEPYSVTKNGQCSCQSYTVTGNTITVEVESA